jgi:broad specificity phosphatase PhoE
MSAERVLLWRHGRTAYNHEQRWQGQLDVALDDVGRAQAERAADVLAPMIGARPPLRIVSSDLARAVDTARTLAARLNVPVEVDEALREVDAGEWEGRTRADIVSRWPDDFAAWRRGDDIAVGGGETRSQTAKRAAEAIRRADEQMDGGTLVVASHGGALRGALLLLLGLDLTAWGMLDVLGNARWAEIHRRGTGWVLRAYNVGVFDGAPGGATPAGGGTAGPVGPATGSEDDTP